MGDYAEMTLDGTLDEYTGEYLGEGAGYPRTRRSYARTDQNKMAGIYTTMRRAGIYRKEHSRPLLVGFHPDKTAKDMSNKQLCLYATDHFHKFKKYINKIAEEIRNHEDISNYFSGTYHVGRDVLREERSPYPSNDTEPEE